MHLYFINLFTKTTRYRKLSESAELLSVTAKFILLDLNARDKTSENLIAVYFNCIHIDTELSSALGLRMPIFQMQAY